MQQGMQQGDKSDFLEGKRQHLKKGVFPSAFKRHPSHLQPKNEKQRSDTSETSPSVAMPGKLPFQERFGSRCKMRIPHMHQYQAVPPQTEKCASQLFRIQRTFLSAGHCIIQSIRMHRHHVVSRPLKQGICQVSRIASDFGKPGPAPNIRGTAIPEDKVTLCDVIVTKVCHPSIQSHSTDC